MPHFTRSGDDDARQRQSESSPPSIAALPTIYQGIRFRSRLEARVAAMLDRLGAAWEYEPEAFRLSDGTAYLPDFRVSGNWIEVKPLSPWADDRAESKIGKMAESAPQWKCFLLWPNKNDPDLPKVANNTVGIIRSRGVGFRASAVWSRCPNCAAIVPWAIGDESPAPCCGSVSETEAWWDNHYSQGRRNSKLDLVFPQVPQWQDGRPVFVR